MRMGAGWLSLRLCAEATLRRRPRCAMLWSADAHQGQYGVQIIVALPRVLSLLWCGHGRSRLPALLRLLEALLLLERGCARLLVVVRRGRLAYSLLLPGLELGLGSREEGVWCNRSRLAVAGRGGGRLVVH